MALSLNYFRRKIFRLCLFSEILRFQQVVCPS